MGRSKRVRGPARQPAPTERASHPDRGEPASEVERGAYWRGPLPPPAALEAFSHLVPDAPERIFRQWEAKADHRRTYEPEALGAAARRDARGQISARLFALSALAVAAFALWLDQPWVAGTIGGGTIASVVGAFLFQRATSLRKPTQPSPPGR